MILSCMSIAANRLTVPHLKAHLMMQVMTATTAPSGEIRQSAKNPSPNIRYFPIVLILVLSWAM